MADLYRDSLYEIRVSLWIVGFDCDPDDISAHLELRPDHFVRKGQHFPPPRDSTYRAKHNVWALRPKLDLPSPLPHCIEMSLLLEPLRAALESRFDKLATLPACAPGSPHVSVYVLPWQTVPAFSFASEDFDFLNRVKLPFEIDIQNFAPDEKDQP